jgi:hypothetical protein
MTKRRRKKALLAVVGVFALACLAIIAYSYYQEMGNNKQHRATPAPLPTVSPAPTATPTPEVSSPPSDGTGGGRSNSIKSAGSRKDAVDAAVQAIDALSTAPFLAKDQQRELLRQKVAPGVRSKMRRSYPRAAARLRRAYGYLSNTDALIHLEYQEVTTKYKVVSYGRGKATVVLYSVSNFTTRSLNSGTYDVEVRKNTVWSVQTVRMEWHNNHWLYASSTSPPKGRSNEFYTNYMEGLKPYVYKKSENDG